MKTFLISIIIFFLSFELSAEILMEVLDIKWQYAISVISVICAVFLTRTPLKYVEDKVMTLLFACNLGMLLINLLNILLVHNWSDKILLINFSLAFLSILYFYISKHVIFISQPEK